MISNKKHIQQLAALLHAKGVNDIIISPGSRNGPLIHTLVGAGLFSCRNIVDERSAAYFAIGLSQVKQKPIVLVCSSGTATLNYAPAVAEAFYLNIPLIVITADRPEYWIDQGESQCIRQGRIYQDFTKKEVGLPLGESTKELCYAERLINECLNISISGTPGPVHINIPLEEPLHNLVDEKLPSVKLINQAEADFKRSGAELEKLADTINQSEKILILAGQQSPDLELENQLVEFASKTGAVVLGEYLSNLHHPSFCDSVDLLMPALLNEKIEVFQPDLLISFGGQFVSKSLKQFLRKNKPINHWHLSISNEHFDTYQSLTKVIQAEATDFFAQLFDQLEIKESSYQGKWKEKEQEVSQLRNEFIQNTGFCDLSVFNQIQQAIPKKSIVHFGNSSPVRYALLVSRIENTLYLGNRGTSGIDGCLSTAVGYASGSEKINTIILGDLSFFYDSNALWNKYIGNNLRVIVINNRGGNIFGMIKGPADSPAFHEHFFAENNFKAEGIANTFQLDYFKAENEKELEKGLTGFYSPDRKKAALLEVFTDAEMNSRKFRDLFSYIKDSIK